MFGLINMELFKKKEDCHQGGEGAGGRGGCNLLEWVVEGLRKQA